MTIRYKNEGINLTGTISVLTAPADATILIKQIQINNGSSGAVNLRTHTSNCT